MRIKSLMLLLSVLLMIGTVTVLADSNTDSETTGIKDLLPQEVNYSWSYFGIAEYGHEMTVRAIEETPHNTYYYMDGNVFDASGGESDRDFSLSLLYVVDDNVLIQVQEEEMMLDSDFGRLELIRAPLEQGNTWRQILINEYGSPVTFETTITEVKTENGQNIYTVRYEDPYTSYYEVREIKEGVGVVSYEKLIIDDETGNYVVSYFLNEE